MAMNLTTPTETKWWLLVLQILHGLHKILQYAPVSATIFSSSTSAFKFAIKIVGITLVLIYFFL